MGKKWGKSSKESVVLHCWGGISLTKGYCCLISFRNALLWTIYIINSVDKTKIDCIRKILLSMIKARNYLKALTL